MPRKQSATSIYWELCANQSDTRTVGQVMRERGLLPRKSPRKRKPRKPREQPECRPAAR